MEDSLYLDRVFADTKLAAQELIEKRYENCKFKSCTLGKRILNCTFENCIFEGVNFKAVSVFSCKFINCKFNYTQLGKSKWFDCTFDTVTFEYCLMEKMGFIKSIFSVNIIDCNMLNVSMEDCTVKGLIQQEDIKSLVNLSISKKSVLELVIRGFNKTILNFIDVETTVYHIENEGYLELYFANADMNVSNVLSNKGMCFIRLKNYVLLQNSIFNKGLCVQETNYLTCNKSRIVIDNEQQIFEKNIDVLLRPFVLKYIVTQCKFVPKLVIAQKSVTYTTDFKNELLNISKACYVDYVSGKKTDIEASVILSNAYIQGLRNFMLRGNFQKE